MIIKTGIDLVNINRIHSTYNKFQNRFLNRIYTNNEIAYIMHNGKININALATRFAAKEAFSKALGTGIGVVSWKDIEIVKYVGNAPSISYNKKVQDLMFNLWGTDKVTVACSLTHDTDYAIANVILYII